MPYSEVFTQQGISWDHQVFVAGCRVTGHGLRLQKPLIFGVLTSCVLVPTEFRRSRYIFLPFRLFIFFKLQCQIFHHTRQNLFTCAKNCDHLRYFRSGCTKGFVPGARTGGACYR